MIVEDIQMLRCVDCGGELSLAEGEIQNQVIEHGILGCLSCARKYPILEQVGIFFRREVLQDYIRPWERERLLALGYAEALEGTSSDNSGHRKQVAVAQNWEYQWNEVFPFDTGDLDEDNLMGERLFWTFIRIDPDSIAGKVVFVACGGGGRETYHISKQNPAKILVNEIGSEIYSIRRLVADAGHRLVLVRSDVSHHPVMEGGVDIAICDHALQHVLDHTFAFSRLATAIKPDGCVAICVYSRENNFLMTHMIEPAKRLLKFLPLKMQRGLSLLPATAVFLLIKGLYVPAARLGSRFAEKLPLFDHMMFWSKNSFQILWMSCFDLIHAPIAYYFGKDEVESLASKNSTVVQTLVNTHGTTWSLVARKPGL